jgi:hypothetical protein
LIEINSEQISVRRNSAVLGYVMPYSGHRSAPFMLAAFAGVIHERQGADGQKHDRGEDNQ